MVDYTKGGDFMKPKERQNAILNTLKNEKSAISASALAEKFSVSRQAIVGDIALLRAREHKIIATARGYILESNLIDSGYTGTLVCFHAPERTKEELYTIIDLGGKVHNVSIYHDIYDQLEGHLNLTSRAEVDEFLEACKTSGAKLLTELTDGIHSHTISCKDKDTFEQIKSALKEKELLYPEE